MDPITLKAKFYVFHRGDNEEFSVLWFDQNFLLKSGNTDKILLKILSPNTRSHQFFPVHIDNECEIDFLKIQVENFC